MIRIRLALFAVFTLLVLSACHTIEGMGKDIQSAGGALEDVGNR